jgi:hypothetical protein
VTLTERALDKALALFREAGVMPPTDEDGWARIGGRWVRLRACADPYDVDDAMTTGPVYRMVEL